MAVTPDGMISLPVNYLRQTLANCATWIAWTGAADAAAALAYIHVRRVSTITGTLAVVEWDESLAWEAIAGGGRNYFEQAGELHLIIQAEVDSDHDEADAFYTFANNLGAVVGEMQELAGQADYLNIESIRTIMPPARPTEDERQADIGDIYQAIFAIGYMG